MTESSTRPDIVKLNEQEWELVRLKPHNEDRSLEEEESSYFGIYVLLRKTRDAFLPNEDNYFIEIHPLVEVSAYELNDVGGISEVTWEVCVNCSQREVRFAKDSSFIINNLKLRNRGLASWVLSDLIRFAQQNFGGFSVGSFAIRSLDDPSPEGQERIERIYQKFGLPAKKVSQLREHRNLEKVEGASLKLFMTELLAEYSRLNREVTSSLEKEMSMQSEINSLQQKLRWRTNALFLISAAAGFLFILRLLQIYA